MSFSIDPELRHLIPPLSSAERDELRASLLREGCRDALVVWNEEQVLLDGHNRHTLCEELGLEFCTTSISLPNRDAARAWILRNQLARRNLTPYQRAELALALAPTIAAQAKENQRRGGGSGISGRQNSDKPRNTKCELAAIAGVSHDTISKARIIQDCADEEMKQKLRTGELSVNMGYRQVKRAADMAKRAARRKENADIVAAAPSVDVAVANAKFSTIVADPPWHYDNDDLYGRGRPEYTSLSLDELKATPVTKVADEDAHLYLWATNPKLRDAFEVLDAWGFRFVGFLTWCKPRFGMGRYFRSSTEHVLFGVKGSLPLRRKDVGTWFEARRGRHSAKPRAFFDLVESCSPGPYLEMFARDERPGWTTWGGELRLCPSRRSARRDPKTGPSALRAKTSRTFCVVQTEPCLGFLPKTCRLFGYAANGTFGAPHFSNTLKNARVRPLTRLCANVANLSSPSVAEFGETVVVDPCGPTHTR